MKVVGIVSGFRQTSEASARNKGIDTGNIKKDGYRVTARASDGYRKDVRRGHFCDHRSSIFESEKDD
jgi:hypothetical protein